MPIWKTNSPDAGTDMARVLLADDNPALLAAAGRLLRECGHEVTSTNSGADAVCLLAHKPPPDVLVLDMVMPGLDGHQVLDALGPTAPPVIVITGDQLGVGDFESGKVSRVLAKPFGAEALLGAVRDVLNGQSLVDTKESGEVPMTESQRDKAVSRLKRNGGLAGAT